MIVAISPHLDDAVFSCGGWLLRQREEAATVVTCFTQSVLNPTGFALACQLDKGLDAGVDYMHLRRAEDERATALLGVGTVHLPLPEAPHRGYCSAADLFAGVHEDDAILLELTALINDCFSDLRPTTVLYPYGAGNHCDHLQVIYAVEALQPKWPAVRFLQYYDQPYTYRHADRYPELDRAIDWSGHSELLPRRTARYQLSATQTARKHAACAAYTTQVGFQFGDKARMQSIIANIEYYRRVD